jgi:hypothetical protein
LIVRRYRSASIAEVRRPPEEEVFRLSSKKEDRHQEEIQASRLLLMHEGGTAVPVLRPLDTRHHS